MYVVAMPGWIPSLVKFAPKRASRFATRMSHTSASPKPPPIAWPCSAPITGISICRIDRNGLYIANERSFGSSLRAGAAVALRAGFEVGAGAEALAAAGHDHAAQLRVFLHARDAARSPRARRRSCCCGSRAGSA